MSIKLIHKFEDIVSVDNILEAWQEFLNGKRNKADVQKFYACLMDNILSLHKDLINHNYRHGGYRCFRISDPKPRIIHKASVRDRLLHHTVYRKLYPFFDKLFMPDSFSCRKKKGTHKALNKFRNFAYLASKNNTKTCWILKCDIKKFFASIDQNILVKILQKYISDKNIIELLQEIIFSFNSGKEKLGLPLGNLTSQLLANIYMNEFDRFVKYKLKVKYYIRYADDFIILSDNKQYLENILCLLSEFLEKRLNISLHPDKIYIKTLFSGIDFLGWKHFFDHRTLRKSTKLRILRNMKGDINYSALNSYFGFLKHGNAHKIRENALSSFI